MTIEDETGIINLIIWKHVQEHYRRIVYNARLVVCQGVTQREGLALHVVANKLWDWSQALDKLDPDERVATALPHSRDFH